MQISARIRVDRSNGVIGAALRSVGDPSFCLEVLKAHDLQLQGVPRHILTDTDLEISAVYQVLHFSSCVACLASSIGGC
jgi:hypothetical protein